MQTFHQEKLNFSDVFDTLPQAFLLLNKELKIQYITPFAAKLFGYEKKELLHKELHKLFPEHYQDHDQKHQVGYFEGPAHEQDSNVVEFIAKKKDGAECAVECTYNPYDYQGRMLMMCTIKDLTEQKQYDAEIRRMASCLNSIGEAVCMTDLDGVISYVNPAFERITGYSKEEVIGNRPKILRSDRHDDSFYQSMWHTILNGETYHGEVTNIRKDKTTYDAELTIAPVLDRKKNPIGFVAVQKEIRKPSANN